MARPTQLISLTKIVSNGAATWRGETKTKYICAVYDQGNLYYGLDERELRAINNAVLIRSEIPEPSTQQLAEYLNLKLPNDYQDFETTE